VSKGQPQLPLIYTHLDDRFSSAYPQLVKRQPSRNRKSGCIRIVSHPPLVNPIPMRPLGYFARCYSKSEIAESNLLAKASLIRPPNDLE
jgi:hypothetical protein